MLRKVLHHVVTPAASLILTAAVFFGMAAWRRSEDATWCRNATTNSAVPGLTRPATSERLEQERSACRVQRQHQRAWFGAVWRSDGRAMAECGFEWARFQIVTYEDPKAASAVLAPYGIDAPEFDGSSGTSRDRFIQACLSHRQARPDE